LALLLEQNLDVIRTWPLSVERPWIENDASNLTPSMTLNVR
jgi:hypothetical protein